MEALQGWKTYICAAILILGAIAYALGIITSEQLQGLWAIFGPLALAALKSGQGAQSDRVMNQVAESARVMVAVANKDAACPPRV